VPCVYDRWPAGGHAVRAANPQALRQLTFASGSMGPKVDAACRFVEGTGNTAFIGALEDAPLLLSGMAGTAVPPGAGAITFWEDR